MAFTVPTITHNFSSAPGSPAVGAVNFTLQEMMTNGSDTLLPPAIVAGTIDSDGDMSVGVTSNLDPGTVPPAPWNAQWRVDIDVPGALSQDFTIVVPPIQAETNGSVSESTPNTIQLSVLSAEIWMVGQSVSGDSAPEGTIITAIDNTSNTVTLSEDVTAGTGLSFTFGEMIDLQYLLPSQPQPI